MWTELPPEKGHTHSHAIFGPCLLWPNGWMDEDTDWYGSTARPHCTRRGPSSRERRTAPPPIFGPCLLWPRSPISATAEILFYCWSDLTVDLKCRPRVDFTPQGWIGFVNRHGSFYLRSFYVRRVDFNSTSAITHPTRGVAPEPTGGSVVQQ